MLMGLESDDIAHSDSKAETVAKLKPIGAFFLTLLIPIHF